MPEITTFLTYSDDKAEEAVRHYLSIFEDGKILSTMPGPGGKVMGLTFRLANQTFIALNAPGFSFAAGMSLFVSCESQKEIDRYYDRLAADGGKEVQCGWVTDKFGVSWQIVPKVLGSLLGDADRDKAGRAMQAMMGMKKLVIADLQAAFDGK